MRIRGFDGLRNLFGPDAHQAPENKNGGRAEANRHEVDDMLNIARSSPREQVQKVELGELSKAKDAQDVARIKSLIVEAMSRAAMDRDLVTETVVLTPAMAEYILREHNKENRGIRNARIAHFAKIIREGEWRLTSQGISFADDGKLNDGQHRLSGIARGGRAVPIRATFGEARDAFKVLDTHKVRGGSDTLHVEGFKNTANLAAAGRLLAIVESGNPWANFTIGNAGLIRLVEAHPDLPGATTVGSRIAGKFKCSTGGATLAFYMIDRHSQRGGRLAEFADRLIDNANQGPRSPITALRDGLMTKSIDSHLRSAGNRGIAQAAAIIKTWNLWVSGKKGSQIRWEAGENFPLPL